MLLSVSLKTPLSSLKATTRSLINNSSKPIKTIQIQSLSSSSSSTTNNNQTKTRKLFLGTLGLLTGCGGAILYSLDQAVKAQGLELHPPKLNWPHHGFFQALDHASVRRGYEVFKQVCAACHSLRYVAYRNFVNVTHTEAEAKAEAEEHMVEDGPDDEGNMFQRPGKLSDHIPPPYPNIEAARFANNGSYPPDLSYIVLGRKGGEDYIFSLLTGYCDPPAGVQIREGQNYNPYFIGGAIAMAQPLFDDSVTYSDGTPSHASQLAKDLVTFLKWAGEPEYDDRKLMMIKILAYSALALPLSYYLVRMKFISIKTRKIALKRDPPRPRKGCDE